MSNKKIVLASQSPRRQSLLKEAGLVFEVRTKEIEEVFPASLPADEVAEYLSKLKATAMLGELNESEVLVTADTVVVQAGKVLGKPKSHEEAFEMLKAYSNSQHKVITGVALFSKDKHVSFSSVTTVYFNEITDEQINYYIENYQPYDKAGAYGIQEWIGMIGIKSIEGSYYNVVGLPVDRVVAELDKF